MLLLAVIVLINNMLKQFLGVLLSLMMAIPFAYAEVVEPIALELAGQSDVLPPTIKLNNDDLIWLAKKTS